MHLNVANSISDKNLPWDDQSKTTESFQSDNFSSLTNGQCFHFITSKNTRKPLVFWCFQENGKIDQKRVKISS